MALALVREPAPDSAREILRVSFNKYEKQRSNDEQHDENLAAWPELTFGKPYREVGSASEFARKPRDEFPLLIADLEQDRFGAAHLVMWENSRGSRQVEEWVQLIKLCALRGVKIAVTVHGRIYDPRRARDKKELIDDANDAEYSSAQTSERIRRTTRSMAAKGHPHGKLGYGWRRVYSEKTGELLRQEPDPKEAAVVQRIFAEWNSGRSIRTITAGLNADGIMFRERPWVDGDVAKRLRTQAYAGDRTHNGTVTKEDAWTAIVDRQTWDLAQKRREQWATRKWTSRTQLLTGVARCGICGFHMRAWFGRQEAAYTCTGKQCTSRRVERLDKFVTVVLLARLGEWVRSGATDLSAAEDPVVVEAKNELDRLKSRLAEAMALWREDKLSPTSYADMEASLRPRIAEAERQVRRATIPVAIDLPDDPARIPRWWVHDLDDDQRRAIVSACIVEVRVLKVGRGRKNYDDADYAVIEWRR